MRLSSLGEAVGDTVLDRVGRVASRVSERTPRPVDVLESDAEYLVVFDAPGVDADDVQVGYTEAGVEVRLDRFRDPHPGYDLRFPGRPRALDASAALPDDASVTPEDARAELTDDGTLRVFLPKA